MLMNWKAAIAIAATLLAACGGGADRTKAQVRMVNASADYTQLELRLDNQVRLSQVAYGTSDGYIEVDPGKASSTISSTGSATPLLSFTPSVSEKKFYTLLAYGPAGALRQLQLDDNTGAPDTGRALLRVFNASSDAGALDVYLTATGDALDSAVAVQTSAAYGVAGTAATVFSGTWRLRVTAAGSKTDVRLDMPALVLPSKHVATLVLTPTSGGVLVNALVLAQQAAITRQDALHARVRLAHVVTDSATLDAQLGTVVLAAGSGAPALSSYALVPTGAVTPTLTLNGQALSATPFTLVSGRDYTLMVHGLATAAQLAWLTDDNRLPSDSARLKLRLINGLADSAAPLAMTLDAGPVASNVTRGTASAYAVVDATTGSSTDGKIAITASGLSAPLFTANDQLLRANANYSVFLVGRQAAPTGIVRRDR